MRKLNLKKRVFTFSDGQVVYGYGYDSFIIGDEEAEIHQADDIPDELFFDAMRNSRLYDFDKEKQVLKRNKKSRRQDEPPPQISDTMRKRGN